jgi:hypothetical protein
VLAAGVLSRVLACFVHNPSTEDPQAPSRVLLLLAGVLLILSRDTKQTAAPAARASTFNCLRVLACCLSDLSISSVIRAHSY